MLLFGSDVILNTWATKSPSGFGSIGVSCLLVALAGYEHAPLALRGRGGEGDKRVEQLRDAGAAGRVDEQHGDHVSGRDGLMDRRGELVDRGVAGLHVGFHERLVGLDDGFDQRRMALAHVERVAGALGGREHVDHALAAIGGQVDRVTLATERLADAGERFRQIDVLGVNPRHHDHAGQAVVARRIEHSAGVHADAAGGGDDDGGGVRGGQGSQRGAAVVGHARRVGQVDQLTVVFDGEDGGIDAVLAISRLVVVVEHARTVVDAAEAVGHAGPEQDRLAEGGLARRGVPNQGYVTDVADLMYSHSRISVRQESSAARGSCKPVSIACLWRLPSVRKSPPQPRVRDRIGSVSPRVSASGVPAFRPKGARVFSRGWSGAQPVGSVHTT